MRRARAAAAAVSALLAVACPGPAGQGPPPPPSPTAASGLNVLLVTVDTLRADHLGCHGYFRATSPNIDALAAGGTLFEKAYTYWPKTRGSFVMIHTGREPSENGYGRSHPLLVGFNATLASVLSEAGYRTAAVVDNPNVSASLGYAKGFETYRETWQEKGLPTETDRTRAITAAAVRFLREAPGQRPFLLWLHYVNPHAPYTPPPPYDSAFLDERAASGPRLRPVAGFHGGVKREWAVPGRDRLGYYVAQYDGEIAAVDREVGEVLGALGASGLAGRTLVVFTSDHGESLGEHDYYFDHGEDVFDPCLSIPLLVRLPGAPAGHRVRELATTLDLVPTILDAVKVSYPPGLAGASLLGAVRGGKGPARGQLVSQNDRGLTGVYDDRYKLVAVPRDDGGATLALYDRREDPAEVRDVAKGAHGVFRGLKRELELFVERSEARWVATRRLLEGAPGEGRMTPAACENLKALGYVQGPCPQ